jgi:hypothetical protein
MAEQKSVLIDDKEKQEKPSPKYSDDEVKAISAITVRLRDAQQNRDQVHPEFNNQTFMQNYTNNERIANTFVPAKKKEGDVEIATGTVEQKLFAVLSEINRLNLTPEVIAFNEESEELVTLGYAMTDILFETAKREEDDEHKMLRQLEMMKQGHVFVQEQWVKRFKKDKTINKNNVGKIDGVDWTEKLELIFDGPERRVLYAPGVYLGNVREPDMKKQPYVFTHRLTSYEEAKSRYGMTDSEGKDTWDRWKNVPRNRVQTLAEGVDLIQNNINGAWTLLAREEGYVEEIHYQDPFNNEYQIFLNGIAMLPVGFPLSAISPGGQLNIEKQILQYINPFFAYGRSFVAKVKEQSDVLDEMLRLLVLKTRKSIAPPYANSSGRMISSKVLLPGRITMGIDANSLTPIGQEAQGATSSEYQMYKLLQDQIDENTVSKQFTGQQGAAGTTAFEVGVLQKQAQKLLGLTIFANVNLEMKLGYLRLFNVLENYFEPLDTKYNRKAKRIDNIFRGTNRKMQLGQEQGEGIRQIVPTNNLPTSRQVREEELFSGTPSGGRGPRPKTRTQLGLPPLNKIYINPERLKKAKILWYIDVDTKEKETGNVEKLMFREELADIALLMNMGATPNIQSLQGQHAIVWNRPKDKLFKSPIEPSQVANRLQEQGGGRSPGGDKVPLPNQPQAQAVAGA